MNLDYSISLYLDTRRPKDNHKYPVKLRVYDTVTRKQKLYPTAFDFSEKEFNSVWLAEKPRKVHKDQRKQLKAIEVKADNVAEKLTPFTFEVFERKLYRKAGEGIRVSYHYNLILQELTKRDQLGTASNYHLSQKSISEFVQEVPKRKYDKLTFFDITPEWLKDYEHFMTETKGRSLTTVSIYVRALRAIFNKAIDEKEIEREYYPFGKRKYQVPATRNIKKALSREQLKTLFHAEPETPEQQKAKDFWFFSYSCNGMNMKDIALLRFKDIQYDKVEFYRAKTRITSKGNLRPITAYLNDFSKGIIERYGSDSKYPESFVFEIIGDSMTAKQQQIRIKAFTRFVNQHIKKLSKTNELPEEISTYWARHSFATNAVRNGATMEFIQESLGHKDLSTTQNYFAGFDSETKKKFANTIMNFD